MQENTQRILRTNSSHFQPKQSIASKTQYKKAIRLRKFWDWLWIYVCELCIADMDRTWSVINYSKDTDFKGILALDIASYYACDSKYNKSSNTPIYKPQLDIFSWFGVFAKLIIPNNIKMAADNFTFPRLEPVGKLYILN